MAQPLRMPAPIEEFVFVDDDDIQLEQIQRLVAKTEFVGSLRLFSDSREALAYIKKPSRPPIDLLSVDIRMPAMTGIELLREATREQHDLLDDAIVIVISNTEDPKDLKAIREMGLIDHYLRKPLKHADLEMVARSIESRRAVRTLRTSIGPGPDESEIGNPNATHLRLF
ncbi:MAG: response regulator [Pseudomonadota bacterium]